MLRNRIIAAALCAGLALSLGGCMEKAEDKVSETVSRVESELEGAGSRIESAVDSMVDPDSSTGKTRRAPPPNRSPAEQKTAANLAAAFCFAGGVRPGPFLVYWDKHLLRRRDTR